MLYRDFPLKLRVWLTVAILATLLNAIVIVASVTSIVALLQGHQSLWTLLGVILGALGSLSVFGYLARLNRNIEAKDVTASLHAEIADRAARCLHDYNSIWRARLDPVVTFANIPSREEISAFRPFDPVVYPSIASKLGLLPPGALPLVIAFFYRLNVIQREIDDLLSSREYAEAKDYEEIKPRLGRISVRYKNALEPAARALAVLGADNEAARVEGAMAQSYNALSRSIPLRQELIDQSHW